MCSSDLDWDAAETAYRRAWAFDARSYRIPLAVGDFFLARATWDQPERVNFAQTALRWFDRAYTRNPYATEALIKMGRVQDLLGRREQALERYQRALDADPRNAAFHTQLALHYLRWDKTAEARRMFQRALSLDPNDETAAVELQRLGESDS